MEERIGPLSGLFPVQAQRQVILPLRRKLHAMEIPDSLLAELKQCLVDRKIDQGLNLLGACTGIINELNPEQPNAAAFLGYLAQWVDIGFADAGLVRELLSRFPKKCRETLSLMDYAHLRMAYGLVAMAEEEFDKAVGDFEAVLSFEDELSDREVVSIAHFWIARCHRRQGRYQEALHHTAIAKEVALSQNLPRIAAVMQILEGWVAFQEAKPEEAGKILGDAEAVLCDTDDYVTLGNIQSAYGRIARRQGRFQQALEYFARAIEEYKKRSPRHRNLARSLVNIAYAERLIALNLRARIDHAVARRRKSGKGPLRAPSAHVSEERKRLGQLREQALEHLKEAGEIYRHYDDHLGAGTVHMNTGLLYLDNGQLDGAKQEAEAAYRLGREKRDYILLARARILESAVELARFEEQVEENAGPGHPAQLAADYAREAVECAKHTQNRRLMSRAYLALGMVLCNDFFNDLRAAQECCESAAALLHPREHDDAWAELQKLRAKLVSTEGLNFTLREWSQGLVGERTFQQISEEFAGIVISKVWLREGKKVSRVVEKLSISPKKVRRVLRNLGLLEPGS